MLGLSVFLEKVNYKMKKKITCYWFMMWAIFYKIKKVGVLGTPTQLFSCKICEIFINTYFEELLL